VDYESIAKVGAIMGSGGMIVMNDQTCMVDMARFFMDFIQTNRAASARRAVKGRGGCWTSLKKITQGRGEPGDIDCWKS